MQELMPYIMSGGLALISGLCGICVKILWRLTDNIAALNEKMAVIVSELSHGQKRIERIEEDLSAVGDRLLAVERSTTH